MIRCPLEPPAGSLGRCRLQARPPEFFPPAWERLISALPFHEVSDFISPVFFPVPPGRLEANQTLEGAAGSITSVDFDPSVRGLSLSDM